MDREYEGTRSTKLKVESFFGYFFALFLTHTPTPTYTHIHTVSETQTNAFQRNKVFK